MNNKFSIIIPIYKGKEYLTECLNSVSENLDYIYKVYLSVNNSETFIDDLHICETFKHNNNSSSNIIIFPRKKYLDGKNHSILFFREILALDKETDFFLILCHDDRLSKTFSKEILEIDSKIKSNISVSPSRAFYTNTFNEYNFKGIYHGFNSFRNLITSKEDFLKRSFDLITPNNISGVIISLEALNEYLEIAKMMEYGYRSEYIIHMIKSQSFVMGTKEPLVDIRHHEGSQGSFFHSNKYNKDEALFHIYCLYSQRNHDYEKLCFERLHLNSKYTIASIIRNRFCYKIFRNKSIFKKVKKEIIKVFLNGISDKIKRIIKQILNFLGIWEYIKKCRKSNL